MGIPVNKIRTRVKQIPVNVTSGWKQYIAEKIPRPRKIKRNR